MSDYTLSHLLSKKCKKVEKVDALMAKAFAKAAKAKDAETKARIAKGKVVFKGKKEQIQLEEILKKRKNKEKNIVVIATKVESKKKPGVIFALRFANSQDFDRFWAELDSDPKEEQQPQLSKHSPSPSRHSPPSSKDPPSSPKVKSSHDYETVDLQSHGSSKSSTSTPVLSEREGSVTSEHHESQTHKRGGHMHATLDSSSTSFDASSIVRKHSDSHHRPNRPTVTGTATYVTTDVLEHESRSRPPRRKSRGRVRTMDVYPMEEVAPPPSGHRIRTQPLYLNYIPGKGLVRSSRGNVQVFSAKKQSASPSSSSYRLSALERNASFSSSSSSSRSSSGPSVPIKNGDAQTKRYFQLVPLSRSNEKRGEQIARPSSSSASSSSSSMRAQPENHSRVNVWKYRGMGDSSSSSSSSSSSASSSSSTNTLDTPIVHVTSRARASTFERCPTCQRRRRSHH